MAQGANGFELLAHGATESVSLGSAINAIWAPDSAALALVSAAQDGRSEINVRSISTMQEVAVAATDDARNVQYVGEDEIAYTLNGVLHTVSPTGSSDRTLGAVRLDLDPTNDEPYRRITGRAYSGRRRWTRSVDHGRTQPDAPRRSHPRSTINGGVRTHGQQMASCSSTQMHHRTACQRYAHTTCRRAQRRSWRSPRREARSQISQSQRTRASSFMLCTRLERRLNRMRRISPRTW